MLLLAWSASYSFSRPWEGNIFSVIRPFGEIGSAPNMRSMLCSPGCCKRLRHDSHLSVRTLQASACSSVEHAYKARDHRHCVRLIAIHCLATSVSKHSFQPLLIPTTVITVLLVSHYKAFVYCPTHSRTFPYKRVFPDLHLHSNLWSIVVSCRAGHSAPQCWSIGPRAYWSCSLRQLRASQRSTKRNRRQVTRPLSPRV